MQEKAYSDFSITQLNEKIFSHDMLSIKNINHIWTLKNADNKLWGRYSEDEGKSWTDWQELVLDYNGFISFVISDENILHLICKNSNKYIQYCYWQGQQITSDLLDYAWIEREKISDQKVIIDNSGTINLFIFTENLIEQTWKIRWCFKSNGQWSKPLEIDSGLGPNLNQSEVALGPTGAIHIIYQIFKNGNYQLIYRKKLSFKNHWSEKVPITASIGINLTPSLVVDENGIMHLTWLRTEDMSLRVMYKSKTKSNGAWMITGWEKEQYLSEPNDYCYSPIIKAVENKIEVFWQQEDGIYKCTSYDGGLDFPETIYYEKYKDRANFKHILLDLDKLQGFNIASFHVNSSTINLFMTEAKGIEEKNVQKFKDTTQISNLKLNDAWQSLQRYLDRIDGNFRRLLFEMEDLKYIDLLRETVEEQAEIIETLKAEVQIKEEELKRQKDSEQALVRVIEQLKNSIEKERIRNSSQENLTRLAEENAKLRKSLIALQKMNEELKQRAIQKEGLILRLKEGK